MLLLENYPAEANLSFEPEFYRIYKPEDELKLTELLQNEANIQIHDQISTQLDDLV